jgi:hypothetical protein
VTSTEWLRAALTEHLDAEAAVARARGRAQEEEVRRAAAAARARLGTGEARERLEEVVGTRAIDAASHAALLTHLANAAEAELLARAKIVLAPLEGDRIVLGGRPTTLIDALRAARSDDGATAEAALIAIDAELGRERARRIEAWDEAAARRARIRARGPASTDDAPADLAERCAGFLDATDDAAADLVARAHHAARSDERKPVGRIAALAPSSLDRIVSNVGRTERIARTFAMIGLGDELGRRVSVETTRALVVTPIVLANRDRATVLASAFECGVPTERGMLGATMEALVRSLSSPASPVERARPPIGSVAAATRALFEALLAVRAFVAKHVVTTERECDALRVAAAASTMLEARHACAVVLAGPASARSDEHARELAARALGLDPTHVSAELAHSTRSSALAASTRARTRLAALAWAPALRERYDEDWYRNPRFSDWVRGLAVRADVGVEAIEAELGTAPTAAAARALELVTGPG